MENINSINLNNQKLHRESIQPTTESRGFDVSAGILGILPRTEVKSIPDWQKTIEANLLSPNTNPSMLLIRQKGNDWIDKNIAIERTPDMTDYDYQRQVVRKRLGYNADLALFLERYQDQWSKSVIHHKMENYRQAFGVLPIPDVHLNDYKLEEFALTKNEKGEPADVIQVISDKNLFSPDKNLAIKETLKTWHIFRDQKKYPQNYVVQLLLVGPYSDVHMRSHVFADNNSPWIILNLNGTQTKEVAVHEAIHLAFTAQSGLPLSLDFSEGLATRLGYSLAGNNLESLNNPKNMPSLLEVIKFADIKQDEEISSHTQLLDIAKKSGNLDTEIPTSEFSYLYGYAFASALLQSPEVSASAHKARQTGENPYQLLLQINSDLSRDSLKNDIHFGLLAPGLFDNKTGKPKQRKILEYVLRKNNINTKDIFRQTGSILADLLK